MPWILGNDSSSPSLGLRFIFERSTLFPDNAANSRRSKMKPDPSEYLRHALVAHRWEKSFQLTGKVPDKVRVTVDRLDSLYQVPFPLFVQSAHPDLQRLQVHEENPSRFLQRPSLIDSSSRRRAISLVACSSCAQSRRRGARPP